MLQKIALGFVCALIAMVLEAVVEVLRIHYAPSPGGYYDLAARGHAIFLNFFYTYYHHAKHICVL